MRCTGGWGIAGYTYEGINKQVQQFVNGETEQYIVTSRKALGWEEYRGATEGERLRVLRRWGEVDIEMKRGNGRVQSSAGAVV
jgi:hypothetical protein